MRIGIVINDIDTELANYTSTCLAMNATNMGHEVWYINVADFAYDPDEQVHARTCRVPKKKFRSPQAFMEKVRGKSAQRERISIEDLDVLLLRNDAAEDANKRPWARLAGINFGRLAMRHGVIILNDPNGLAKAINKLYLQYFPVEVRPRTLISRDSNEIKTFIREQDDRAVLKPLSGSGGHNVFLVQPEDKPNINQMIEAVSHDGYVIAQEYLPEAAHGDTRLILMNGYPLTCKGRYAAYHRERPPGDADMRSNITAGAIAKKAHITEDMLHLAETVRAKLIQDGMFLVGLDIVGNKLMEINVFSPAGLVGSSRLEERNFCREVILALERKVEHRRNYPDIFDNLELATL
jgi:glutathione synthase